MRQSSCFHFSGCAWFSTTRVSRMTKKLCGKGSYIPIARMCCYMLLLVAAVEFILINFVAFYVYKFVSNELSQIHSEFQDVSFFGKLQNNAKVNYLIETAKDGGFVSLLQETVERLYIVKKTSINKKDIPKNTQKLPEMYSLGIDVSHSGETSFIYQRILNRRKFPYEFFIVDIGANDGFISSNSFNFIQMGWDAVLVEPQIDQIRLAKKNLKRYIEVNRDPPHKVHFLQAAVGRQDGAAFFLTKTKTQESRVLPRGDPTLAGDRVIQVPRVSVRTLASKYSIPKNFGILSIDAEGMGLEILRQWFALKYTPAYIIFETLHMHEPWRDIAALFKQNNYVFIGTKGWNVIYEHYTSLDS